MGIGFSEIVIIALFALFWAVVAVLVISMLRWAVSGARGAASGSDTESSNRDARQILDERYASGELDREEYAQMRRDIEAN
ncbi:MAG: SHOCT domain-containing protein [Rubrobacteraceae bacterium]